MWKIVTLLIFTLIIVPLATFNMDEPLNALQKNSMTTLIYLYLATASLCFIISSFTDNYSQVDKIWSIMPIIYVWIVCVDSGFEPRILLMALLVTIWGIRLTYNFARRGGYSWKFWEGEEDYRWSILRAKPEFQATWKWILFNLFFISLYQMGLILLFTLPILKSMNGITLGISDWVLSILFIGLVFIESIADQQQWNYQSKKHRLIAAGQALSPEYQKGFTHHGLWAFSRHPNYAAEQAIWIVFYLFSVTATGIYINWSIAGCILLLLLFKGSSDFSEGITLGKYPDYIEYQKKTGRFVPKILPAPAEPETSKV